MRIFCFRFRRCAVLYGKELRREKTCFAWRARCGRGRRNPPRIPIQNRLDEFMPFRGL